MVFWRHQNYTSGITWRLEKSTPRYLLDQLGADIHNCFIVGLTWVIFTHLSHCWHQLSVLFVKKIELSLKQLC